MKAILMACLLMTGSLVVLVPSVSAQASILDLPPCNPGDNEYYCRAKKSYDILYDAYLKPIDAVYECMVNGNCPPPLDRLPI